MDDFAQKALLIAVSACVAAGITLIPGPVAEVQFIAYGLLALIAMAVFWAINARRHRLEREEAEAEREKEHEMREQERWDKLNKRLDDINERLNKSDEADKAMLRAELVRAHREWVEEKGYITLEAHEYTLKIHTAYTLVGGNDTGDKLWKEIDALPIEEKR